MAEETPIQRGQVVIDEECMALGVRMATAALEVVKVVDNKPQPLSAVVACMSTLLRMCDEVLDVPPEAVVHLIKHNLKYMGYEFDDDMTVTVDSYPLIKGKKKFDA